MKRRKKNNFYFTSLFLSIIFFFAIIDSNACSCQRKSTIKSEFKDSKVVFTGKVIRIGKAITMIEIDSTQFEFTEIIFEVIESYKGNNQQNITIYTPLSSEACGFTFKEKEVYLVYAFDQEEKYITNSCFRTAKINNAIKDVKCLNRIVAAHRKGSKRGNGY